MTIIRIFWLGSGNLEFATLQSGSQFFQSLQTLTVDRRHVRHFLVKIILLPKKISENFFAKVYGLQG